MLASPSHGAGGFETSEANHSILSAGARLDSLTLAAAAAAAADFRHQSAGSESDSESVDSIC